MNHSEDDRPDGDLDALPAAVLSQPEAATLQALQVRLTRAARAEQLLEVGYTTVSTPVGSLLVAGTDRGLVRVAFDREDHDLVLRQLAETVSPRILSDPEHLAPACDQLQAYFSGSLRRFELALDLRATSAFRRTVLDALRELEFGRTASYGQIAGAVGRPGASRAVGTVCATNPLPIVIGCHRVVRSDGTPGHYLGGERAKRLLLELERERARQG